MYIFHNKLYRQTCQPKYIQYPFYKWIKKYEKIFGTIFSKIRWKKYLWANCQVHELVDYFTALLNPVNSPGQIEFVEPLVESEALDAQFAFEELSTALSTAKSN